MTDLATTELTADEARALTGEIRQRLDGLLPLIKRAYEGRADRALGYESWQAYCAAELNDVRVPLADRPAMVAELRAAGMSQRAIGSALGVSKRTVETDLASSSHLPTSIQGTDGKRYAATRPHTPAITPEPEPDGTDVAAGSGPHTPARQDPDPAGPGVTTAGGPAGPSGPAVELPPPLARTKPAVDPIDDPEFIRQQRRRLSSEGVAKGLVALHFALESDPLRWLGDTWQPDAYRERDLPRVRDAFTASGLRAIAKNLDTLADHLDRTGGSL